MFLDDLALVSKAFAVSSLLSPYTCFECGSKSREKVMKRCGGCNKVFFCGEECSKAAWKKWHKALCAEGRDSANSVSLPPTSDASALMDS